METVSLPVSLGTTASVSESLSSERVTDPQGRDMQDRYREGEPQWLYLPSSVSVFVQGEGIDRHSGYL